MADQLHVFAGSFPSRDDACLYTEQQWEPEPDDSVSDAEYEAWENRNPLWGLRQVLGVYLDPDFIETIEGDNRYDYLRGYLADESDLEAIRSAAGDANVLVLMFPNALGGNNSKLESTSKLVYCGAFGRGRP